ncbi:hypothetical protein CF319_g212 [Tilletia indica]|nr:hypothetical protein CF319_g212 [Tilletia indica]
MPKTRRQVIQAELVRREYCTEDDSVFAEFVDLMYGNKKTKEAIDAELSELIGPDYNPSFTDWLFRKAEALAAGIDEEEEPARKAAVPAPPTVSTSSRTQAPSPSSSRRPDDATRSSEASRTASAATAPPNDPTQDERSRRIPPHMLGPRGFSRPADSYRPTRMEPNQQSRSSGPRELFASAMNQARRGVEPITGSKRTMAMRSPSPVGYQNDTMRAPKRAAMDDPSLRSASFAFPDFERNTAYIPPKEVRIRGVGAMAAASVPAPSSSAPAPAPAPVSPPRAPEPASAPAPTETVAVPTAPRGRGVQELFPGKGPVGTGSPQRGPTNAGRQTVNTLAPTPSIFQRTSVPDPRASSFVPQTFRPQPQQMQSMDVDMAPASAFGAAGTPHYNPLFFGGNMGATSGPLTEPPLAARLSAMLPDNNFMETTPTIQPVVRANDISEFPTVPLDVSLCKWDLKCTNPMCRYSHATPSAANSSEAANALVLKQEACSFGPRCSKKDCVSSHPSPAVTMAYAKAGLLSSANHQNNSNQHNNNFFNGHNMMSFQPNQSVGTGGGITPVWNITPGQVRCRWQSECKNPTCPFQHFDNGGSLVVPPARSAAATASASKEVSMSEAPAAKQATPTATTSDGKPAALDRALGDNGAGGAGAGAVAGGAMSGKRCKWGADCRRADCMYGHPPTRPVPPGGTSSAFAAAPATNNSNFTFSAPGSTSCRYGLSCFRADCFYSHPPGRKVAGGGGSDGMVNRMARFNLPADTKMETIIPQDSAA